MPIVSNLYKAMLNEYMFGQEDGDGVLIKGNLDRAMQQAIRDIINKSPRLRIPIKIATKSSQNDPLNPTKMATPDLTNLVC